MGGITQKNRKPRAAAPETGLLQLHAVNQEKVRQLVHLVTVWPQTQVTESKRADVGSLKTRTLVPPESKRNKAEPEGPDRAALAERGGQALLDPALACKHVAVGYRKLLLRK